MYPKELADVIASSLIEIYNPRNLNTHSIKQLIHHTDLKYKDDIGALTIITKDEQIFSVIVAKIK
jgi:hypothetical protein